MVNDEVLISAGTPESRALDAKVRTAIERCERLNRLAYADADAVRAYLALFAYPAGFVAFEAGRPAGERDAEQRADLRKVHETLPSDEFPTTRGLARRLAKRPGDAEFTYGLERLLDGFGVTRRSAAPSGRAAPRAGRGR